MGNALPTQSRRAGDASLPARPRPRTRVDMPRRNFSSSAMLAGRSSFSAESPFFRCARADDRQRAWRATGTHARTSRLEERRWLAAPRCQRRHRLASSRRHTRRRHGRSFRLQALSFIVAEQCRDTARDVAILTAAGARSVV